MSKFSRSRHSPLARQGLFLPLSGETDIGVLGPGFLALRDPSGKLFYSRASHFSADAAGNLVDGRGAGLLGWGLDERGGVSGEPRVLSVRGLQGAPRATTHVGLGANLDADAPFGVHEVVPVRATDASGRPLELAFDFEKRDFDRHRLTIRHPDGGHEVYALDLLFSGDGTLRGFDLDGNGFADTTEAPALVLDHLASGAEKLSITLNLAAMTRYPGGFSPGRVEADGGGIADLAGLSVGDDGTVSALFTDGTNRPCFRIRVATFADPAGLRVRGSGLWEATESAGEPVFVDPGRSGAGRLQASAARRVPIRGTRRLFQPIRVDLPKSRFDPVRNLAEIPN